MANLINYSKAEDALDQIESLRADDDPAPLLRKALRETLDIIKNMDQSIDERIRAASKSGDRKRKSR